MKQVFKVGDKVYCPAYTNRVCVLSASNTLSYPLVVEDIGITFTKNGMRVSDQPHPCLFHATEENRKLLTQLHGVEFEKPKVMLEGSELTRYLLQKDNAVLCYIINTEDNKPSMIGLVVKYCTVREEFIDINGYYWNDATPLKYFPKDELTPLKMEI